MDGKATKAKCRRIREEELEPEKNQKASTGSHACAQFSETGTRKRTHGLSLPPVTISPSRSVVYMANTGPLWALATTLHSMWSLHTQTSPLMVPVNVKLF